MDDNDWNAVYTLMGQVFDSLIHEYKVGYMSAYAVLDNYPPCIYVRIKTDAGVGDQRSPQFTQKELGIASNMVIKMADKALDTYPWLVIKNSRNEIQFGKEYVIRPRSYPEVADIARSRLRSAHLEKV